MNGSRKPTAGKPATADTNARTKLSRALASCACLLALVAGAVSVSGCGASATLDPVARAAVLTSEQAGAKVALSVQVSSAALPGGTLAISANGYIDERNHAGLLNMDLSQIPGIARLGGDGSLQMLFRYPVIYMHMPFLAGKLPAGKTWVKLDLRQAAQAAGVDLSQLSSFDQVDPSQFLDFLRASSGGVAIVGKETVDGTTTTHYYATLELGRILARLPGDQQAAVRAGLEKLGESGSIPVDVWVDAQGRVRREQLAIGASVPAGTPGAEAGTAVHGSVTIDFQSFGAVPAIVAPPDDQTVDLGAIAAAAHGGP